MRAALARFKGRAHAIVPTSPLHPLSHFVYAVLAVWVLAIAGYFAFSTFRFGRSSVYAGIALSAWALISGLCARRYGMRRIANVIECVMVLPLIGAAMLVSTVITARHSLHFVDEQIRASDAALGFDWLQLFAFLSAPSWSDADP